MGELMIEKLNKEELEKSIKTELLSTTIFDADLCQCSEVANGLRATTKIEDLRTF